MAMNRVSTLISTFSFLLLISLSQARFPTQLPLDDASPEDETTGAVQLAIGEASDLDPKILLPTDKLRDPSNPASSSAAVAMNLEARSEGKDNLLATDISPEENLPAAGSFTSEIVDKVVPIDEPLDVADEQRKPYDMVFVRSQPSEPMNPRLDRSWTMRQSFFRPRTPDFYPNLNDRRGPHHRRFPDHHEGHQPNFHHHEGHQPNFHHHEGLRPNFHHHESHQPDFHHHEGHQPDLHHNECRQPDFHHHEGHQPDFHHHEGHQPDFHHNEGRQPDFHHHEGHQPDFHQYHDRNGDDFQGEDAEFMMEPKIDDQVWNKIRKFLPQF